MRVPPSKHPVFYACNQTVFDDEHQDDEQDNPGQNLVHAKLLEPEEKHIPDTEL